MYILVRSFLRSLYVSSTEKRIHFWRLFVDCIDNGLVNNRLSPVTVNERDLRQTVASAKLVCKKSYWKVRHAYQRDQNSIPWLPPSEIQTPSATRAAYQNPKTLKITPDLASATVFLGSALKQARHISIHLPSILQDYCSTTLVVLLQKVIHTKYNPAIKQRLQAIRLCYSTVSDLPNL